MMFKSMHQCSKNQMAQYLAMAVQYFQLLKLTECGFHINTTTLVVSFCLYMV